MNLQRRLREHLKDYAAAKEAADRIDELEAQLSARCSAVSEQPPFQKRVHGWMMDCFSMEICRDRQERNHRFLEEALELVQACECTASEAHQLVDYVYGRDQGDINQEVGGVMVTLAALCLANDIDMHQGGETELARILQPAIMNKIRAKQAAKPTHSPLPVHPARNEPQSASEDPTASKEWNDGCDFAMTQLCKFLDVEPRSVSWDAATETVEGDVSAVIGNILRAKFGEDWGPQCQAVSVPTPPEDGLQILEGNCWDLRCIDIPTGGGDADIGWNIVEHHMGPPKERIVGRGRSPREALQDATSTLSRPVCEGK